MALTTPLRCFARPPNGKIDLTFGCFEFLDDLPNAATCEPIVRTDGILKSAIAGWTHEYTDMYPGMAETAREEAFTIEFAGEMVRSAPETDIDRIAPDGKAPALRFVQLPMMAEQPGTFGQPVARVAVAINHPGYARKAKLSDAGLADPSSDPIGRSRQRPGLRGIRPRQRVAIVMPLRRGSAWSF